MDKLSEKQQELLSQYVDGLLSADQKRTVEAELQKNEAMREHLSILNLIGQTLRESRPDSMSRNFTEQVMLNLQEYSLPASKASFRNGILLLIGVVIVVGVSLVLLANGIFDNAVTALNPSDLRMPQGLFKNPLPTISLSGKVLVNAIVILNIVLAWIVLDRTILRPLFQRRMKA